MRQDHSTLSYLKGIIGIPTAISLGIILLAVWLQLEAIFRPQPGLGYIFMGFWPFVLLASIFLFIKGVVILVKCVHDRGISPRRRTAIAVTGLIFLLPGIYLAYGLASSWYVEYNAQRTSTNSEVLQLVQQCKIRSIRREYSSWDKPADQRTSTAAAYLADSAKSRAEKQSYFYGHRSFNPNYYDELAMVVTSDSIQSKCGKIDLYDEHRESIPITYSWVSKQEALEAIGTCKMRHVFTADSPVKSDLAQASDSKSGSEDIFMIIDPIAEGYAGELYLRDATPDERTIIVDAAQQKKGSCLYKWPHIDGKE